MGRVGYICPDRRPIFWIFRTSWATMYVFTIHTSIVRFLNKVRKEIIWCSQYLSGNRTE